MENLRPSNIECCGTCKHCILIKNYIPKTGILECIDDYAVAFSCSLGDYGYLTDNINPFDICDNYERRKK